MRLRAFLICSVVVAAAASTVSSCSRPGESRAADAGVSLPGVTPSPVNTQDENKPTAPAAEGKAYLSGDIKIVAVELKEKNARLGYELEVSYPQIDGPRTPRERKFNLYVRNLIERDVKDFKAFCRKNRNYPDGSGRRGDYHMGARYDVLYATPELLSIDLTMESFTGYVNSDWFPVPLNYDLKAGRPLKHLADLFEPKSKFLESIAAYCVDELMRRGLNCGSGGVGDEQWLRRGAEPKAENYSAWNLTRDGVQITFGEYQVGPGCLGLVDVVVPYDYLRGMLRRDVEMSAP